MNCDLVVQRPRPARLSTDHSALGHTRYGLVVGTILGTAIRSVAIQCPDL